MTRAVERVRHRVEIGSSAMCVYMYVSMFVCEFLCVCVSFVCFIVWVWLRARACASSCANRNLEQIVVVRV